MVQPSSPVSPTSPYNWRSVEEPASQISQNTVIDRTRLTVPTADPRMVRKKSTDSEVPLSQIPSQGSQEGAVKKKSSWFRKWKEPSVVTTDDNHLRPRSPMPWSDSAGQTNKPSVLNRDNRPPHLDLTSAQVPAPKSSSSSEFPMRRESKGFSKWFGRKKDSEKCKFETRELMIFADLFNSVSPLCCHFYWSTQSFLDRPALSSASNHSYLSWWR